MAAFNSPPSRFSISECSLCFKTYHPQKRIPRLMKVCGHTFCERCLIQLRLSTSASSTVSCPSCRKETKVEEKDPFPKNYALLEIIEHAQNLSLQQEGVQCDGCSNKPAEFGCEECRANLCGKCWGKIHIVGALRSHTKLDCSQVVQVTCPNHPTKTADLICLEKTCASYGGPICLLCEKTALHKGHLTEPVEQVAEKKRNELREIIEKAQKSVDFALTALAKVHENDELLHDQDLNTPVKDGSILSNRARAIRLIDDTFNALFEELTQRRDSLIQQVGALVNEKATKLEEQKVELSTFLSRSYQHLQEASQILKKSNDHQLLSAFRAHYDPLVEISHFELFPQPVATPLIDLSFPENIIPLIREVGVLKNDGVVPQFRQSANECQGRFVFKFGSKSSKDGQFFHPCGIECTPDGLIYVSDYGNNRIQVIRSDGLFVLKFGSNGSADGQFSNPYTCKFGPDGLLYVSDSGNHRIQIFRSDGTFVRKFASRGTGDGQFWKPFGLAFSPDGFLYVGDHDNHRIQVFSSDGTFVRKFGSNGSADGQFSYPGGMAFSPDGLLYVCDKGNNRIQIFRSDGTFVRKFGSHGSGDGQLKSPRGVTFHHGLLYIGDSGNHRIQVFRPDGTFVRTFGSRGSGVGQFHTPRGVIFYEDCLYICDYSHHQVQVYQ